MTDVDSPRDPVEGRLDSLAGALDGLEGRFDLLTAEVASLGPKLNELLDRHPAGLGAASAATRDLAHDAAVDALAPVHEAIASLSTKVVETRGELAQALSALRGIAEGILRLDNRTDERLTELRESATSSVGDLDGKLALRSERTDRRVGELATLLQEVRALTTDAAQRDAEVRSELESVRRSVGDLRDQVRAAPRPSPAEPDTAAHDALAERVERALATMLRLLDDRLDGLRSDLSAPDGAAPIGGVDAGAVMGTPAAWQRLEERMDREFEDVGRQLHALAAMVERATASAEAAATRPVVTGDQIRHAATSVKDTVLRGRRSRREGPSTPKRLGP